MRKNVPTHQLLQKANKGKSEKDYYSLLVWYARFLAPFYDIFFLSISLGEEPKLREKVADVTGARSGYSILDVATGTGKQAFAFAKRKNEVVAVDLSKDMIEIAKKRNKYRNLTFEIADATSLPFRTGSFDISCVSFALHDMILSIRGETLSEIVRVTRDEGKIVVVDYAVPESKVARFFINIFGLFEPYYGEFIRFDLENLIRKSGIRIEKHFPVLFGFGRILIGKKSLI